MKKIVCLFICAVICVNPLLISADNSIVVEQEVQFQSLLDSLDETEKNKIVIWTEDIDYSLVEKATFEKTGLTRETITDDLGIDAIQNYINVKRALAKNAYKAANNKFYANAIQSTGSKVLFQSGYSPFFIVEGTKNQLASVLKNKSVKSASVYTDLEISICSDVANVNTGAAYLRDTSSILGTGKGVVIGQIEPAVPDINSAVGSYDYFNKSNVTILGNNSIPDEASNDSITHASLVAAIMVGKRVVFDGIATQGVAPDASLVSIRTGLPASSSLTFDVKITSFYSNIEKLLDKGVNIINCSADISVCADDGEISQQEQEHLLDLRDWLDHLAFNHDVHLVVAAGNNGIVPPQQMLGDFDIGYVGYFAHSYNAIVVGGVGDGNNITGRNSPSTLSSQINPYYNIYPSSSYKTMVIPGKISSGLCKPDIACFAERIAYASYEATGTSCAAPLVSGMIAQLASIYPSLLTNNSGVKALLAAGAVYRAKDTNTLDKKDSSSELFDRQGAGIANVYCSYASYSAGKMKDLTLSGTTASYSFNINVPSSYEYLRVAMSWIRRANIVNNGHTSNTPVTSGPANLDIHILKDGKIVAMGENAGNNMEVLQFAVTEGGTYTVKIYNRSYEIDFVDYGNQYVSVAWY